jgi:hypothetical protein
VRLKVNTFFKIFLETEPLVADFVFVGVFHGFQSLNAFGLSAVNVNVLVSGLVVDRVDDGSHFVYLFP